MAPKSLPPTDDAAEQHALRSWLQTQDWLLLRSMANSPVGLGFTLTSDGYEPVARTKPMAPDGLLNLISCNCKKDCSNMRCSCKRNGVKCISACGNCHGTECQNATTKPDDDDTDDAEE